MKLYVKKPRVYLMTEETKAEMNKTVFSRVGNS